LFSCVCLRDPEQVFTKNLNKTSPPTRGITHYINLRLRFFIRAQVNNTHHIAILDTGSSITIIHNRFLRTIQHNTFTPFSKSYSSANCTRIEIVGEVLLEIKINNIRTSIKASVASHLVTDLLLGADWIDRHVISIHPLSRTILVRDENGRSTTVPIIRPTDPSCSSVTLIHRTVIPAYSESAVAVHIPVWSFGCGIRTLIYVSSKISIYATVSSSRQSKPFSSCSSKQHRSCTDTFSKYSSWYGFPISRHLWDISTIDFRLYSSFASSNASMLRLSPAFHIEQ
jgi:hypothetical protein